MYTRCLYTVPITAVDIDFPFTLNRDTHVARGTMDRNCVYTVPITAVDTDFPLNLQEERCKQNVFASFPIWH